MTMNKSSHNQSGSAFIFILIGIALFAALSYAVSQMMRVSSDNEGAAMGTRERGVVAVTDVMQFMEALKMRVLAMGADNVPDNLLDFRTEIYLNGAGGTLAGNMNSNCTDPSCRVFTGATALVFKDIAATPAQTSALYPQNGHGRVGIIDISGVGSTEPDLVFVIYGVKPNVCNIYNAKQGITTNYDATTSATSIGENGTMSTPDVFTGGYTTTRTMGYGATMFEGKKSFCAPASPDAVPGRLGIWHVLKIR